MGLFKCDRDKVSHDLLLKIQSELSAANNRLTDLTHEMIDLKKSINELTFKQKEDKKKCCSVKVVKTKNNN